MASWAMLAALAAVVTAYVIWEGLHAVALL
jgi:hypothetical protein